MEVLKCENLKKYYGNHENIVKALDGTGYDRAGTGTYSQTGCRIKRKTGGIPGTSDGERAARY